MELKHSLPVKLAVLLASVLLGALIYYVVAPGGFSFGPLITEPLAVLTSFSVFLLVTFFFTHKRKSLIVSFLGFGVGVAIANLLQPTRERFVERSESFDAVLYKAITDYNIVHISNISYSRIHKPWFSLFKNHEHKVIVYRDAGYPVHYIYISESLVSKPELTMIVVNRQRIDG